MQILQKENIKHERLNAIRQMIVTINHEINNPLAALLGNVELLLDNDRLTSMTRSRLTEIKESSLRIRDVVKKISAINDPSTINYSNDIDMIDLWR